MLFPILNSLIDHNDNPNNNKLLSTTSCILNFSKKKLSKNSCGSYEKIVMKFVSLNIFQKCQLNICLTSCRNWVKIILPSSILLSSPYCKRPFCDSVYGNNFLIYNQSVLNFENITLRIQFKIYLWPTSQHSFEYFYTIYNNFKQYSL